MTETDFERATRESYDAVAAEYAAHFWSELAGKPLDRAMLAAFAELVRGPVADVGCGPGRTTAHLRDLGADVFGLDLSPGMVEVARTAYPDLRFATGSMLRLPVADGALGGLLANYSIIHVPPEHLPAVFAEFRRVLAPGGRALLVFQVGDEPLHMGEAFGRSIALDFHRNRPDRIAELLAGAGLPVQARMLREADPDTERGPQAYLLAGG